jgi:hypothetical protein
MRHGRTIFDLTHARHWAADSDEQLSEMDDQTGAALEDLMRAQETSS